MSKYGRKETVVTWVQSILNVDIEYRVFVFVFVISDEIDKNKH